ncbi:hypothetical protein KSP40_PGU000954 [Platanthera guangdongensis]|uniref:Uncharacterized protein n=1 Tax=Platanthera guangdongensis TaxID=2320717 RepID=A0ABR2MGD5_9ASPA
MLMVLDRYSRSREESFHDTNSTESEEEHAHIGMFSCEEEFIREVIYKGSNSTTSLLNGDSEDDMEVNLMALFDNPEREIGECQDTQILISASLLPVESSPPLKKFPKLMHMLHQSPNPLTHHIHLTMQIFEGVDLKPIICRVSKAIYLAIDVQPPGLDHGTGASLEKNPPIMLCTQGLGPYMMVHPDWEKMKVDVMLLMHVRSEILQEAAADSMLTFLGTGDQMQWETILVRDPSEGENLNILPDIDLDTINTIVMDVVQKLDTVLEQVEVPE